MRSVDKGGPPTAADGSVVAFNDYRDAAPHLMQRLGRYCSYCERTIPTSLAVEHKLPKRHDQLERDWHNLLLACANCNSSKRDREVMGRTPLWPDEEDTFSMIEYRPSGQVLARKDQSGETRARVDALLDLVGLAKTPATLGVSDHRWFDRLEVWRKASQSSADLREVNSEALRRATIETAKSSGGYSIWRAAFADDPDMTQRLIAAFPGTRPADVADATPSR